MQTETISPAQAAEKIRSTSGRYFTVDFIKRTNGAPRTMTARLGVSQGVTGEGKAFDPKSHHLITVSETVRERDAQGRIRTKGIQFRHIPIENIRRVTVGGQTFQVTGPYFR